MNDDERLMKYKGTVRLLKNGTFQNYDMREADTLEEVNTLLKGILEHYANFYAENPDYLLDNTINIELKIEER